MMLESRLPFHAMETSQGYKLRHPHLRNQSTARGVNLMVVIFVPGGGPGLYGSSKPRLICSLLSSWATDPGCFSSADGVPVYSAFTHLDP